MKRRLATITIAVLVLVGLTLGAYAAVTSSYTDVSESHWASSSIESCTSKGLMQGTGDDKFEPEATLTRAQVAQVCYNAYKDRLSGTIDKTLADVPKDSWYYDAVYWMTTNGIINGTTKDDGKTYNYYPNAIADRKYVALALYRLANKLEVTLPETEKAIVFPDIGELGNEYQKAINALQRAGIISGYTDGTFKPDESLTRAQAAKLFDLFTNIEKLKPTETPPTTDPTPPTTTPPTTKPTDPTPTPSTPGETPAQSNNWDFDESVTYSDILKPYAESLGYTCSSYTAETASGYTRYYYEFTNGDNMVHVDAMTLSEAKHLEEPGSFTATPYRIKCGTIDWVQKLKSSPFVLVADGIYSGITSTDFIKEKLSELS